MKTYLLHQTLSPIFLQFSNSPKTAIQLHSRPFTTKRESSSLAPSLTIFLSMTNTTNRELKVFHKDALLRPLEENDQSDSFYDFTEADYDKLLQAKDTSEPLLKTKIIRDREEKEAAEKLDPIRIRYVFHDGLICQAQFSSLESIGHLLQFLKGLLLTEYQDRVCLFTVPPKRVLVDEALTLFHAKLVPDAYVFVEFQEAEQLDSHVVLKPSILEMQRKDEGTMSVQISEVKSDAIEPVMKPASLTPDKRQERDASAQQAKQVPKWFKMGKK